MNEINIDFINGYLLAFSRLNSETNQGCSFDISKVELMNNLNDSIKNHLNFVESDKVTLIELVNWQQDLFKTTMKWFYYDWPVNIPENLIREDTVNHIIKLIEYQFQTEDLKLFNVISEPSTFYELDWNDFLIKYHDKYYLLHFGMSD